MGTTDRLWDRESATVMIIIGEFGGEKGQKFGKFRKPKSRKSKSRKQKKVENQ
jgi:hypothetical protein